MKITKEKLALMLAGLATISTLGGCSLDSEEIKETCPNTSLVEMEQETVSTIVFAEGTHIVQYLVDCDYKYYMKKYEGYVPTVMVPEGYRYDTAFSTTEQSGAGSRSAKIVYIFVNDVPVEVEGVLDKNGNITYPNPGKPVENTLKLVPNE